MASQPFNKFDAFVQSLAFKKHNLAIGGDVIKVMLTTAAPVRTNSIYTDISGVELANGNGYTTGGITSTVTTSSQASGLYTLAINDVTWTATAAMGPFRYVVVYNNSATSKDLIGWWDNGANITLNPTETFTSDFDNVNGILTLT